MLPLPMLSVLLLGFGLSAGVRAGGVLQQTKRLCP
jgi:hypothetical protein